MMQWTDNTANRTAYTNSNSPDAGSTASSSISAGINVKREQATDSAQHTNTGTNSTDHLQFCLSMLPQNCSFCGVHPLQWGREEVQQWLKWCINEFSFTDVQADKFAMNGKALILLRREDFVERAPSAGDVLYNIFHKLLESQSKNSAAVPPISTANMAEQAIMLNLMLAANNPFFAHSFLPGFPPVPFPGGGLSRGNLPITPPATGSPGQPADHPSVSLASENTSKHLSRSHSQSPRDTKYSNHHSSDSLFTPHIRGGHGETKSLPLGASMPSVAVPESVIRTNHAFPMRKEEPIDLHASSPRAKSDCRLLWEFISKLLKDNSYTEYIKWENASDYTFRIVNPAQLSRLWGIQKNRTNMTYEKLSRALRYYYRMDIIEKVPGRRLTYRFMRPPHEIKRGQRGAKPGVPRKSRSTDEETEELDDVEVMEAVESELLDDENRVSSAEYPSISPTSGYFPKQEPHSDSVHPIDLVRHQRHSNIYNPADLNDTPFSHAKAEPLMSQLRATNTNPSLGSMIKSEIPDWATGKNSKGSPPRGHVE